MAGKPLTGEGLSANLAGMTKNQLYDIMSQMKTLIEQNRQQAREILIQNPPLTKALFQAQIMLGMVQSPQVIPNIQAVASLQPQQPALQSQQSNILAVPGQVSPQDQTQAQPPIRKQHQTQQTMSISSGSAPTVNLQSQPMPSHSLQSSQQPKVHMNPQATPTSQLPNVPPPTSLHQPQIPAITNQLQQPLQTTGFPHLPLQAPLASQSRPPSMPPFHHQYGQQMVPNAGFQQTGGPLHSSQPIFHSANKPQSNMGTSFQQGQPHPNQPPSQSLYQMGGSHIGSEFNNQVGSSMQIDRASSWMSGPPDSSTMTQLPGPPSFGPGQISSQPSRSANSAQLTPDMEKALLQQVMSLTPDQINHLPPEQRNQVLQLQQMLRQ